MIHPQESLRHAHKQATAAITLISARLHPHLIAQMRRIHKQGDMKLLLSRHTHAHVRACALVAPAESAGDMDDPAGLLATAHLLAAGKSMTLQDAECNTTQGWFYKPDPNVNHIYIQARLFSAYKPGNCCSAVHMHLQKPRNEDRCLQETQPPPPSLCWPQPACYAFSLQGSGPLPFHLGVTVTRHQLPSSDRCWSGNGGRGTWVEGERR